MTVEQKIITGDARDLIKTVERESVDLILTDPVYDDISAYAWLSEVAARALKPDCACLVYVPIGNIPAIHRVLENWLRYRWHLVIRPVNSKEFHGRLCVCSQHILWYEKGKSKLYQSLFDVQLSTRKGSYRVNGSNWGKGTDAIAHIIAALTKPGDLVLDPFTGSGTIPVVCKRLERSCIGFEIDPKTADEARTRLRQQQEPLPLLEQQPLI